MDLVLISNTRALYTDNRALQLLILTTVHVIRPLSVCGQSPTYTAHRMCQWTCGIILLLLLAKTCGLRRKQFFSALSTSFVYIVTVNIQNVNSNNKNNSNKSNNNNTHYEYLKCSPLTLTHVVRHWHCTCMMVWSAVMPICSHAQRVYIALMIFVFTRLCIDVVQFCIKLASCHFAKKR